jgi:hypothetical protein
MADISFETLSKAYIAGAEAQENTREADLAEGLVLTNFYRGIHEFMSTMAPESEVFAAALKIIEEAE